jgi:glycerate dehydrogenase
MIIGHFVETSQPYFGTYMSYISYFKLSVPVFIIGVNGILNFLFNLIILKGIYITVIKKGRVKLKQNILVSFNPNSKQIEIIENELSEKANIYYLESDTNRTEAIEKADIIFSWNPIREFDDEEYKFFENVKLMQLLSAGGDHLPFEFFPDSLIVAGNVGAYAQAMAEHALAMALSLSKNLFVNHQKIKEGVFDQSSQGKLVHGANFAIIGFGGIGKEIYKLLQPFDPKIYAINTTGKTDLDVFFAGTVEDLNYVLSNADFIFITIPLTKKTKGMIGKTELNNMKDDAILVNVARGEIIDQKDLYEHLLSHPEFKAGIDAWWIEPFRHGEFKVDYPFVELPNVIGSPHNSGMVPGSMVKATVFAVKNILEFLNGNKIKGVFNRAEYR